MKHSPTGLFGLDRDMGYTRQEFMDQLPRALSQHLYGVGGNAIDVKLGGGGVSIRLGDESERVFSPLVRFPILPVRIAFTDVDAAEQALFMERFDRSYMKSLD